MSQRFGLRCRRDCLRRNRRHGQPAVLAPHAARARRRLQRRRRRPRTRQPPPRRRATHGALQRQACPSTATQPEAALASGFLFASAGAMFSLMSSFWTWRLVRLARLESSEASGVQKIVRRTQKALRFGAKLNLVGMALTLLAAEQVVGTLIMKALVAPGSLAGVWSGTAPQALQAFNTIDVFVIQATTNTLCAHFISLLSTLSLLARSVKW